MQEEILGKIRKSHKEKKKAVKNPARMKQIHVLIYGIVQGVFFRSNAKELAEKLGITGFIKNLQDGSVEAVACGQDDKISEFLLFLKKGPEGAEVKDIKITQQKPEKFRDFEIRC